MTKKKRARKTAKHWAVTSSIPPCKALSSVWIALFIGDRPLTYHHEDDVSYPQKTSGPQLFCCRRSLELYLHDKHDPVELMALPTEVGGQNVLLQPSVKFVHFYYCSPQGEVELLSFHKTSPQAHQALLGEASLRTVPDAVPQTVVRV